MGNREDVATAKLRLSDPFWRLNHLYWIVGKDGQKQLFNMNWAQKELYSGMWYCNLILKARQLGMSTFIDLLFLDCCLFNSNVAAGVIADTRENAEHLFRRVKFAFDHLPEELKMLRSAETDSVRELVFSNGSSIRVGTSLRSSTLQYLHISEFGKIAARYPEKAREIVTGALNTLQVGQHVFIESTAEGRSGYFYEMCQQARALKDSGDHLTPIDFKFWFFPWWKSPEYVLSEEVQISSGLKDYFESLKENLGIELSSSQKSWYARKSFIQKEDMFREFPSTADEAFESANEGLYYAKQITQLRREGHISNIVYDSNVEVHTAWDLGYGDSTAIIWFQLVNREVHILETYENSGEPLTFYLKLIKEKPYCYGTHLVPHDAVAHEYSTGLTRVEVAKNHGIKFTLVPKITLQEGIDALRNLLPRCWFDENKCQGGISALDAYRRQWDDKNGCWKASPVHDWSSHLCDAFRMMAVGIQKVGTKGMTEEDADRMWSMYGNRF